MSGDIEEGGSGEESPGVLAAGVCREEKNGGRAGAGVSCAMRAVDESRRGVLAVRWAATSASSVRRGDVVTAGSPAKGDVAAESPPPRNRIVEEGAEDVSGDVVRLARALAM